MKKRKRPEVVKNLKSHIEELYALNNYMWADIQRLTKELEQMSVLIGRSMYRGHVVSDIYDSYFMGDTERAAKTREIAELKNRIAELSQIIYEFETNDTEPGIR